MQSRSGARACGISLERVNPPLSYHNSTLTTTPDCCGLYHGMTQANRASIFSGQRYFCAGRSEVFAFALAAAVSSKRLQVYGENFGCQSSRGSLSLLPLSPVETLFLDSAGVCGSDVACRARRRQLRGRGEVGYFPHRFIGGRLLWMLLGVFIGPRRLQRHRLVYAAIVWLNGVEACRA